MNSASVAIDVPVRLSRFPSLRALTALGVLTVRQQFRGWRLLVLSLLFLLPGILATVIHLTSRGALHGTLPGDVLEFAFLFNLIPHALAPLAALLFAAGIIRDDVEEQTLTYLLLRPVPRPMLYAIKLLGAFVTTALLTAFFTAVTLLVIALESGETVNADLWLRAAKIVGILSFAQAAYCGLFGLMGLLMRRSLLVGVAYIVLFEGILASLDTIARKMTVMYYFRVLVLRWLQPSGGAQWEIQLAKAPDARTCVATLLIAGFVLGLVGSLFFAAREFRMKTPEGE